jgi:hypothetical protein
VQAGCIDFHLVVAVLGCWHAALPHSPPTVVGTIKSAETRLPLQRGRPKVRNDNVDGVTLLLGTIAGRIMLSTS